MIKPNYCSRNMVTYHVAFEVVSVVTIPYAAEYNLMMMPTKFKTENIADNLEQFYFRMLIPVILWF